MLRRRELDILYVATRVALLFLLPLYISDISIYVGFAAKTVNEGLVPYRDWDFEYPPLALPFMFLPALAQKIFGASGAENFRVFFGFLLLPFDYLLFRTFVRMPPIRGAAFAYVMLTSALGLLLFDRFDIAVGFVIAWPFLGPRTDRRFWLWWGLGGALKLVPLALAPTRLLDWEGTSREKFPRLVKLGVFATMPLALSIAAVAAVAHGRLSFFSHHSERGVQIESLIGSAVMFLQAFTSLVKVGVANNFGAQHLAEAGALVTASRALFYGALSGTFVAIARDRRRWDSLSASWMVISAFVTFGYVLSPQYFLWLVPIAVCAASRVPEGRKRTIWLGLFAWAVILTGIHFRFYWDYVNLHYLAVSAVLARNALLLALWGASWAWMKAPSAATPPHDIFAK